MNSVCLAIWERVVFIIRLQGNSKEFRFIIVYERKSFAVYLNDFTLLQIT